VRGLFERHTTTIERIRMKYFGISYPIWFQFDLMMRFWKRIMCRRNWHLFDEVLSEQHYLVCDACQLMVYMGKVETKYVDEEVLKWARLPHSCKE
jgi:hypothetical protein